MPSVHILGQILGASGFAQDKLFCKYKIIYDHKSMRLTDGDPEDQTQLSSASVGLPRIFFKTDTTTVFLATLSNPRPDLIHSFFFLCNVVLFHLLSSFLFFLCPNIQLYRQLVNLILSVTPSIFILLARALKDGQRSW